MLYLKRGREDDVDHLLAEEEAFLEEKKQARIARLAANEQALRELQGPVVVEDVTHDNDGPPLSVAVHEGTGSPNSEMSRSEAFALGPRVSPNNHNEDDDENMIDTADAIAEEDITSTGIV